jgi:hypothetical protein
MAFTYTRITLVEKPKGFPRTFLLQVTAETAHLLMGIEIDNGGDEIVRPKADVTKHIISKDLIAKRVPMVMNNVYGMLEKAK